MSKNSVKTNYRQLVEWLLTLKRTSVTVKTEDKK
jgi:hypothetical protein